MVSIVVGLLALMFATRLVVGSEQNRQASLGGSDSMQNGMLALFSISNDAGQAGWGLNDPLVAGCDTVLFDTGGYVLATASRTGVVGTVSPLAAAVIKSNGANPDQLTLYSGSSMSGTGSLRLTQDYKAGDTDIIVDRVPYGFAGGDASDVIVLAPETAGAKKCSLAQVAAIPAGTPARLSIASGLRFNKGTLDVAYGNGQARLFNLGPAKTLSFHTWSVQNGFLQLRATDLAGAGAVASTVTDNVVSLKAQYGFDKTPAAAFTPASGLRIDAWSAGMIDADGDGVIGGATDYQHVAALRVAVVARSKNPEKPNGSGVCTATPTAPAVFSTAEPFGVPAVPVQVNVGVAGDTVDWKCYRYRVFETIVPLRNAGWRPT